MSLVEVEITGQAITAQYGTLNTGDVLRTTAEFAKHLVEDCGAAKYRTAAATPKAEPKTPAAKRPRKAAVVDPVADPVVDPVADPVVDPVVDPAADQDQNPL